MSALIWRSGPRGLHRFLSCALIGTALLAAQPGRANDRISVVLDEAKLAKLPERVGTIIVGNPLIADVTLQAGGVMIVTGKGYGSTNLLALDRAGNVLMERTIEVQGPRDKVVVVYRGVERETYSCTPNCERRITLGDGQAYFESVIGQAVNRTGQAKGQAPVK